MNEVNDRLSPNEINNVSRKVVTDKMSQAACMTLFRRKVNIDDIRHDEWRADRT